MARTIPMILTPSGWESYHVYQEEYGPYKWRSKHPHRYGLLDSIANAGFLPETSMDEILYLEEYGYAERLPGVEEAVEALESPVDVQEEGYQERLF